MKRIVLSLAILILSTGMYVANAQGNRQSKGKKEMFQKHRMHKMQQHRQGNQKHFKGADFLTAEQKETVKANRIASAKKVQPLKNEIGVLKAEYKVLISTDNPNFKALDANLEKRGEIRTEIAKINMRQQMEFRAMLSDEQLVKLDAMQKHRKGKGNNRHRGHGQRTHRS